MSEIWYWIISYGWRWIALAAWIAGIVFLSNKYLKDVLR